MCHKNWTWSILLCNLLFMSYNLLSLLYLLITWLKLYTQKFCQNWCLEVGWDSVNLTILYSPLITHNMMDLGKSSASWTMRILKNTNNVSSWKVLLGNIEKVLFFFFKILFICQRERRVRAGGMEGRGRSRLPTEQRAWCGTRSQDPGIMTWDDWTTQASLEKVLKQGNPVIKTMCQEE